MKPFLFLSFLLVLGSRGEETTDEQKPEEVEHTRLIKVDYTFEAETILYDDIKNKDANPSFLTSGNFTFQTLHYDMNGDVLARFEVTKCNKGPCQDLPPVLLIFSQGGNNLQNAYIDTTNHPDVQPQWNVLWGILSSIYTPALRGEGEQQFVPTTYGNCKINFNRLEDKKYRRKISDCDMKTKGSSNSLRFPELEVLEYSQEALYKQNTKVDADIVIVEAIELFKLRNPLEPNHGFQLESRVFVQIFNRTVLWIPRPCDMDTSCGDCALKHNGKLVGNKIYEDIPMTVAQENKFVSLLEKYRNHLYDMGESHTCDQHSALFAQLLYYAQELSSNQWKEIIMNPENEPVLHVIANILGSLGTADSLKVAREILFVEGPSFIEDYLFSAALSLSNDHSWHKQLMYWLNEEDGNSNFWHIANSVATILRKRCELSKSSLNACNKGKDAVINKFIEIISKNAACPIRQQKILEVLHNLPISSSYELAKRYLCTKSSSSNLQIAALQLIKKISDEQYDSKLSALLLKLFRNTCPQETSTEESQLAIDILVKCLPEQQNIGTHLLRSESLFPDNHEKWQYFYSAVLASGLQDELKMDYWKRMRAFKVFRPNYLQRSLLANSNVHWDSVRDIAELKLEKQSNLEFDDGVFKRIDFDLSMKKGKRIDYHLLGLSVKSAGIDSIVQQNAASRQEPEATVRVRILGHSLPAATIFKGSNGLMEAVWNADGQTVKAFEGNIPLRVAYASFPLLSGTTSEFFSLAAATLKILGSCEVSLWNKDTTSQVLINSTVTFISSVSLLHNLELKHKINSSFSTVGSYGSFVDASFQELPPSFCMQAEKNGVEIIRSYYEKYEDKVIKNIRKRQVQPAESILVDETALKQCRVHAQRIQQN